MTLAEMTLWVEDVFAQMLDWMEEKKARQSRKTIYRAKEYIDLHYQEPITLDMLSEISHMYPTYFSVVFKEQFGKTYVDVYKRQALAFKGYGEWMLTPILGPLLGFSGHLRRRWRLKPLPGRSVLRFPVTASVLSTAGSRCFGSACAVEAARISSAQHKRQAQMHS